MAKQADHYVQAAYLALWSEDIQAGHRGQIFFFDKRQPTLGWRRSSIGNLAKEQGFDQLSAEGEGAMTRRKNLRFL